LNKKIAGLWKLFNTADIQANFPKDALAFVFELMRGREDIGRQRAGTEVGML